MDIKDFKSKKELKSYIHENGFFMAARLETVQKKEELSAQFDDWKAKIPDSENIVVFQAVATTGDVNRNGYGIRETAWPPAFADYFTNPVVLNGHDPDDGIGLILNAWQSPRGIEVLGYAYDDYTEQRITRGILRGISMGHLDYEWEWENATTKQVITDAQMRLMVSEKGWGEWMREWVLFVTKLEWLETSFTTQPANKKGLASIEQFKKDHLNLTAETMEKATQPAAPVGGAVVPAKEETTTPVVPAVTSPAEEKKEETPVTPAATAEAEDKEKPDATASENGAANAPVAPAEGGAAEPKPETPEAPAATAGASAEEMVTVTVKEFTLLTETLTKALTFMKENAPRLETLLTENEDLRKKLEKNGVRKGHAFVSTQHSGITKVNSAEATESKAVTKEEVKRAENAMRGIFQRDPNLSGFYSK